MFLKKNGVIVKCYEPYYANKKIVIAIDSSKSNSAIVVGDTYGNALDDYEIDGKADKDVLDLCWKQRQSLSMLFEGAKIQLVGIEDIITKKSDSGKMNPMDIHMSRFKITAVFMSFISFFQDNFKITPELVNNQHWKAEVLPEEFRKREHKKGSLDYFKSIGSKYGYRTDDVTDAYCIYQFLAKEHGFINIKKIEEPCSANKEFKFGLYPLTTVVPNKATQFEINKDLSFIQNVDTMVFNTEYGVEYCYAKVPVEYLSIEDIYSYSIGTKHVPYEQEVYVFCRIK